MKNERPTAPPAEAPEETILVPLGQATVPVVVDAGLGAPSQAAEAMEMGAAAVLVNTAIAVASDPSRMAAAFVVVEGAPAFPNL